MEEHMNYCKLDPIVYFVRSYSHKVSSDLHPHDKSLGNYECVATVMISGDSALISGLYGNLTKKALVDLFKQLKEKGVKTCTWERHKHGGSFNKTIKL